MNAYAEYLAHFYAHSGNPRADCGFCKVAPIPGLTCTPEQPITADEDPFTIVERTDDPR